MYHVTQMCALPISYLQYFLCFFFFFFNDTATTEIYTLSLHDALPISQLTKNKQHYGSLGRVSICSKICHECGSGEIQDGLAMGKEPDKVRIILE